MSLHHSIIVIVTRDNQRSEVNLDFGIAVRRLRLEAGLSQEALGVEAGLDRTYVSGIERGIRNPTLKIISRLANALGASPAQLLDSATAQQDG